MDLDAEETLFIVSSKTFTTQETMTNAASARAWLVAQLGDEEAVAKHFVAVSTNADGVAAFGIDTEHVRLLGLGRWPLLDGLSDRPVNHAGHRTGTVPRDARGLPRDGYPRARTAPWLENLPVLMGLLNVWNRNFPGTTSVAVLPYEQYLKRFPAYLQQLTMESNGKSVRIDGHEVDTETGAVFWGNPAPTVSTASTS